MQHLRHCIEVERDELANRRRIADEIPRTNIRPDFMLQRLRLDDYEDTFCAGMLKSLPTIDEMRYHNHTLALVLGNVTPTHTKTKAGGNCMTLTNMNLLVIILSF